MIDVDDFAAKLKEEATAQLGEIRAARVYQGKDNAEYRRRGNDGIRVVSTFVRLLATMANERTNDLVERRVIASESATKLLPA